MNVGQGFTLVSLDAFAMAAAGEMRSSPRNPVQKCMMCFPYFLHSPRFDCREISNVDSSAIGPKSARIWLQSLFSLPRNRLSNHPLELYLESPPQYLQFFSEE